MSNVREKKRWMRDTAETSASAKPVTAVARGIQVVAEGTNPIVDIVAVHGLNGHPVKTWTTDGGVNWLRDLLPHDLPDARVLSWGHGARTNAKDLFDHGKVLVANLCLHRESTETSKRPIIFVAHSLGGIIVKSALIYSHAGQSGAIEAHRSIWLSTYGIIFMGTPHEDGDRVAFGRTMVNIASLCTTADQKLLPQFEQDSEWLHKQLRLFRLISSDFETKFAFETKLTPTAVPRQSTFIVPQASAVVPGDGEAIGISADHINMVQFASRSDFGYQSLLGHLRPMVARASNSTSGLRDSEHKIIPVLESERSFEAKGGIVRNDAKSFRDSTYGSMSGTRSVTNTIIRPRIRDTINDESTDSELEGMQHLEDVTRNKNTFRNLRDNLQNPTMDTHKAAQMADHCRFSFTQSPITALQDLCKQTVELLAGTKLSWWPLSEPEEELNANCTRVYCQPLAGLSRRNRSFYDDIPTPLAEELFHGLAAARNLATGTRWKAFPREAVYLEGTTLMRVLRNRSRQKPLSGEYGASARGKKDTQGHTAEEPYQGVRLKTTEMSDVSEHATSRSSTAKGKQPITGIDGRDAEMIEMGEGSKSAAPDNDRNKGPNDDQNAEQPTDDHDADPLVNAQSVLFLCIDVVTNVSIACSVNVGINDKKTMKSLRKSYNALRNSFLWNRKRGVGVKFYRFKSFYYKREYGRHHIELHRDEQRYPPVDDSNYRWTLEDEWRRDNIYPNGEAWYFFSHPDDCGNSRMLTDMLPKRMQDVQESPITVYGLYIEQRHSVWQIFIPVLVILAPTFGGTLWFVRPWLRDHPGDLQGATVPVTLAFTVIQFFLTFLTSMVVFRWSI